MQPTQRRCAGGRDPPDLVCNALHQRPARRAPPTASRVELLHLLAHRFDLRSQRPLPVEGQIERVESPQGPRHPGCDRRAGRRGDERGESLSERLLEHLEPELSKERDRARQPGRVLAPFEGSAQRLEALEGPLRAAPVAGNALK